MSLYWIEPIYDRTGSDVVEARQLLDKGLSNMTEAEKTKFYSGLKGSLNSSDLERIVNDVNIILLTLEVGDEIVIDTNAPLTVSTFKKILDALGAIQMMNIRHKTTPNVPTASINTYQKVNDIEKILNDVYEILMNNFHYYAGEGLFAGDEFALLL